MEKLFTLLVFLLAPLCNIRGMATIPGTPSSLGDFDAAALRKVGWASKLRVDSVRPSVFNTVQTDFNIIRDEIAIKSAGIMLDISNIGQDGAQSVRLGIRTPMRLRAQYGPGETMLGNEDESSLSYGTFYYNEIKKALKYFAWGYYFNDTNYLKFIEGYQADLANFLAENDDSRCQQACLEGFGEELTYAPVSLTQRLNKNWAIPNLVESSYPTWDVDAITRTNGAADADNYYSSRTYSGAGTFVENVAAAMLAGSGTGATPLATLNIDSLATICTWIKNMHVVTPIMLDGQVTWIMKIPEVVHGWMTNPNNSGSLAEYWKSVGDYVDKKRMIIPGESGRLFTNFLIVVDPRCPTLTVGGDVGSYTLQPGYIQPGNNDDRNNSAWSNTSGATNYVFDMVTVLGKNALAIYRKDKLRTNLAEMTEYEQIQGRGAYKGEGIQLCTFDKGTPTASTQIQRGSLEIPVSRAAIGAIAT